MGTVPTMSSLNRLAGAALVLALFGMPLAAGQSPAEEAARILGFDRPRAKLLILGVFHFAYPGLDVHQARERVDVLAPARQAEIRSLVDRLAAYRPTKIAVEVEPAEQPALDGRLRAYLDGEGKLSANEVDQLAFRLAERLDQGRLYAVDAQPAAIFNPVFAAVEAREKELGLADPEGRARYERLYAFDDGLASRQTLIEQLAYMNDPDVVRMGHGSYSVGWFELEGEDGYLGVDFRTAWYNRNLRIFRNLQRISSGQEERILLVIGAGHLPILRFLAQSSPQFEWVEAGTYLRASPPR